MRPSAMTKRNIRDFVKIWSKLRVQYRYRSLLFTYNVFRCLKVCMWYHTIVYYFIIFSPLEKSVSLHIIRFNIQKYHKKFTKIVQLYWNCNHFIQSLLNQFMVIDWPLIIEYWLTTAQNLLTNWNLVLIVWDLISETIPD